MTKCCITKNQNSKISKLSNLHQWEGPFYSIMCSWFVKKLKKIIMKWWYILLFKSYSRKAKRYLMCWLLVAVMVEQLDNSSDIPKSIKSKLLSLMETLLRAVDNLFLRLPNLLMTQRLKLLLAMDLLTLLTQLKLGILFFVMVVIQLEKDVIFFQIPSTRIVIKFWRMTVSSLLKDNHLMLINSNSLKHTII